LINHQIWGTPLTKPIIGKNNGNVKKGWTWSCHSRLVFPPPPEVFTRWYLHLRYCTHTSHLWSSWLSPEYGFSPFPPFFSWPSPGRSWSKNREVCWTASHHIPRFPHWLLAESAPASFFIVLLLVRNAQVTQCGSSILKIYASCGCRDPAAT
jgi:hypothetical protein